MATRGSLHLSRYIYLHMAGWCLFFAYETIQRYFAFETVSFDTLLQHCISFFQACVLTYLFKIAVLDKLRVSGNMLIFFLFNCLLCFVVSYVQQGLYLFAYKWLLHPSFSIRQVTWNRQLAFTFTWMRPVGSWMVAYYIIKWHNQYYGVYIGRLRNLVKKKEAALLSLKKSINPAFIFRSLDHIAGLTENDIGAAQAATLQLSDTLRYYLEKEQYPYVSMASELGAVSTYLAAESRHLQHPFHYTIHVSDTANAVKIPSVILLQAVENAVEQGIAKLGHQGWINIVATTQAGYCHIDVLYSGTLMQAVGASPTPPYVLTAVENIQQQLDYIYRGKAQVNMHQQSAGIVVCSFKIPI